LEIKRYSIPKVFLNHGKREDMSREIEDDFGQFRFISLTSCLAIIEKKIALGSGEN